MAGPVKRSVAKKKVLPGPKNAARTAPKKKGKSPIGPVKEGGFHAWLGKPKGAPISGADIQKGLKAGGHAAKMANFARNAKKWKKG